MTKNGFNYKYAGSTNFIKRGSAPPDVEPYAAISDLYTENEKSSSFNFNNAVLQKISNPPEPANNHYLVKQVNYFAQTHFAYLERMYNFAYYLNDSTTAAAARRALGPQWLVGENDIKGPTWKGSSPQLVQAAPFFTRLKNKYRSDYNGYNTAPSLDDLYQKLTNSKSNIGIMNVMRTWTDGPAAVALPRRRPGNVTTTAWRALSPADQLALVVAWAEKQQKLYYNNIIDQDGSYNSGFPQNMLVPIFGTPNTTYNLIRTNFAHEPAADPVSVEDFENIADGLVIQ